MKSFALKSVICLAVIAVLVWKLLSFQQTSEETAYTYVPIAQSDVCVDLNYHYVYDRTLATTLIENLTDTDDLTRYNVYSDTFEQQIDTLIEEGAYFASLPELITFHKTQQFPEKCVHLSFDDGDRSIYEQAFPILKERQIPFTMFIIAGQVGNPNFSNIDLLNWDELREMQASGLVSFGSHTYDMHYADENGAIFLNPALHDAFAKDLALSKQVMEHELGIPITAFAYPFGNSTPELVKVVKDAGFTHAFILTPHAIDYESEAELLPRYLIDSTNFDQVVTPWLNRFDAP